MQVYLAAAGTVNVTDKVLQFLVQEGYVEVIGINLQRNSIAGL